ncbi:MAG: hypothetical protein LBJ07_03620 [Actinomycetes bacterium]|jgi:hypothetical protein|nr:hypothetical protein [Actinomycetes bacterium]
MKKTIIFFLVMVCISSLACAGIAEALGSGAQRAVEQIPRYMQPGTEIIYNADLTYSIVSGGDSMTACPIYEYQDLDSGVGIGGTGEVSPIPGAKVEYDNEGFIQNILYPDPTGVFGYSIAPRQAIVFDSLGLLEEEPSQPKSNADYTKILGPWGAHSNTIYKLKSNGSFVGVGRFTWFTDKIGDHNNTLKLGDCAVKMSSAYKVATGKAIKGKNDSNGKSHTFLKEDVGSMPDAVLDIWGSSGSSNGLTKWLGAAANANVNNASYTHAK